VKTNNLFQTKIGRISILALSLTALGLVFYCLTKTSGGWLRPEVIETLANNDIRWLDKASRRLRDGRGLDRRDDVPSLLQLSKAEAIERLMHEDEFGDTVLDFNLYFLGFKPNRVIEGVNRAGGKIYNRFAYGYPQTIHAAREVTNGKNFLSLFELNQPWYIDPIAENQPQESKNSSSTYEERVNIRRRLAVEVVSAREDFRRWFEEKKGNLTRAEICKKLLDGPILKVSSKASLSGGIASPLNRWVFELIDPAIGYCGGHASDTEFLKSLDTYANVLIQILQNSDELDADRYVIRRLSDVRELNPQQLGVPEDSLRFS
jgi:hypothetical protein